MEVYDIVMLVVLGGAMLFGAVKGFAWQLASITSIVLSYIVAYQFREPFSQSIQAEPPWNRFLAMLILYVGTSLLIWVAFRMVSGSIDRLKLKEFDRQVGAMFGLAKGALYCILITLFGVTLLGDQTRERIVGSRSGNYIASVLARSESVIPPEIQGVVQPYLDRFEERFHGSGDAERPGDDPGLTESLGNQLVSDGVGEFLPESFWQEPSPSAAPYSAPSSNGWPSSQPLNQPTQQAQQPAATPWDRYQR